jgi:hypothetical protein
MELSVILIAITHTFSFACAVLQTNYTLALAGNGPVAGVGTREGERTLTPNARGVLVTAPMSDYRYPLSPSLSLCILILLVLNRPYTFASALFSPVSMEIARLEHFTLRTLTRSGFAQLSRRKTTLC